MINVEDLREITNELYNYKSVKKIKVTTEFARALTEHAKFEDKPIESRTDGIIGHWDWYLVEIDDEIDGLYEIVY